MRRRNSSPHGFTLVEILLAIAIFVLLAGAIYATVSTAVSATATLANDQIEARRQGSFQDFMRRGFRNLPVMAELSLRARSQGKLGAGQELVIRSAGGAFQIGEVGGGGVVLGTMPDGKDKMRFAITRFPTKLDGNQLSSYLEGATWLPLLNKVESLRWRFWDKNLNNFVETWDQGIQRPEMIEMTFVTEGEPARVCLFRLPALTQKVESATPPPPPPPQTSR